MCIRAGRGREALHLRRLLPWASCASETITAPEYLTFDRDTHSRGGVGDA